MTDFILFTDQKYSVGIKSIDTWDCFPANVTIFKCLITACTVHNLLVCTAIQAVINTQFYALIFSVFLWLFL